MVLKLKIWEVFLYQELRWHICSIDDDSMHGREKRKHTGVEAEISESEV